MKKKFKKFKLVIVATPGSQFQEEFLKSCLVGMGRGAQDLESYHKGNKIDMEFTTL